MTENATERAHRIGRRLGNVLFTALIGTFTLVCSVQVLKQGFFAEHGNFDSADCRSGLRSLAESLRRARETTAFASQNERARLEQFRASLLPEWQDRDEILRQCSNDPWGKQAYHQIERLRWAEEHAVRYESVDLAPSRQTVAALEKTLAQSSNSTP
jgi:hypothetical protein